MKTLELLFAVDVAVSGGGFKKLEAVQSQFSKLQSAGEKLQAQSSQISSYQKLTESVETAATRLRSLQDNYRAMDAGLQASRQKTSQLSQEYDKAKQRVQSWQEVLPKNSVLMQTAIRREKELARAYRDSQKETARLERERDKLYRQVGQQSAKLDSEQEALRRMGQAMREAGLDTDNLAERQAKLVQAQERLGRAQSRYQELRSQLSWDNIRGDLFKSAAAVMAFKKPIQVDMDFEQAMANVRAVSLTSEQEFNTLRNQAIQLGSTTPFTASQAAKSQENLARAGFTAEEIVQTMPGLLNMAAAEGMDLSQASEILAGGMRGMQLPMSETTRLVDTLAYTSAHSKTNIASLGEAFKNVAGTASLLKIKPEQLASYLGAMANMNVEGGEAGNALKSSFMRLSKPPKEALNFLRKYRIAVKTSNGQMRELPDILTEIYKKTEKLGSAEQLKVFSGIFGKNYGDSMIKLALASVNGSQGKLESELFTQKEGTGARMAAIRNDTLQGDITALGSAWEGVMIRIGKAIEPINRFFTQNLTLGLQIINEFVDKNSTLIDAALQAGYALGGWMIVKKVYRYGKLGFDALMAWRELKLAEHAASLFTMGENAAAIASNLGAAATAGSNFQSLLVALAGPIGVIVGASILIAANWKEVTEWCRKAGEAIQNFDTGKISAAKAGTLKRSDPDYGLAVMNSTYAMPSLEPHAFGGILTQPHIGLVAEAGPEAIIPLKNKSRGMQVLQQAANILGVNVSTNPVPGIASSFINSYSPAASTATSSSITDFVSSAKSNASSTSIAGFISQARSSALSSISSFISQAKNEAADFISRAGDFIGQRLTFADSEHHNSNSAVFGEQAPVVNITINASGQESQSLAENIAEKVREVLRETASYEERVSFA
ncbi:MAG: phage tail tape measure protein [Synergistaceae bacterium]|nr:phage tail tape measure protein [Synergistaceae bacterium]